MILTLKRRFGFSGGGGGGVEVEHSSAKEEHLPY